MIPFVHLAAPNYLDESPSRRSEVAEVLRRNLGNPLIEKVHVLCEEPASRYDGTETEDLLRNPKTCRVPLERRSTYADLFRHLSSEAAIGAICVAAYCDIYFDETLAALDGVDLAGMFLATAKWDAGKTADARDEYHYGDPVEKRNIGPYRPEASQDCWIFAAPLKDFPCDWKCGGSPGDENKVAHEAVKAGLIVANPCLTVKAWHLHESGVRSWNKSDRVFQFARVPVRERPDSGPSTLESILRAHGRRT